MIFLELILPLKAGTSLFGDKHVRAISFAQFCNQIPHGVNALIFVGVLQHKHGRRIDHQSYLIVCLQRQTLL